MDKNGHFPGCYTHGHEATRCADARYMRDRGRAEAAETICDPPIHLDGCNCFRPPFIVTPKTGTPAGGPPDWESRAIASAAASLLNDGAREAALELLAATRHRYFVS